MNINAAFRLSSLKGFYFYLHYTTARYAEASVVISEVTMDFYYLIDPAW